MTGTTYFLMAAIGLVVMGILLDVTLELYIREKTNPYLYRTFIVATLFCTFDILWGMCNERFLGMSSPVLFEIISVIGHLLALLLAYAWFLYAFVYLGYIHNRLTHAFSIVPCVIGVLLILSNFVTKWLFYIDDDGNYCSGPFRMVIFGIEILYLLAALIYTIYSFFYDKKYSKPNKRYHTVAIYISIPIIAGVLQSLYPNVAYYSIGYMLAAIVIFTGNIYRDEERRLRDENEMYKASAEDFYNSLEALGRSYVSIHVLDLEKNTVQAIRTNRIIENLFVPGNTITENLRSTLGGTANIAFYDELMEFSDMSTIAERMKGKQIVSHEFLGINLGWCITNLIRVKSNEKGDPTVILHAVIVIDEARKAMSDKALNMIHAGSDALERKSVEIRSEFTGDTAVEIAETLNRATNGLFVLVKINNLDEILSKYNEEDGGLLLKNIEYAARKSFGENSRIAVNADKTFAAVVPHVTSKKVAEFCVKELFDSVSKISTRDGKNVTVHVGAISLSENNTGKYDDLCSRALSLMLSAEPGSNSFCM